MSGILSAHAGRDAVLSAPHAVRMAIVDVSARFGADFAEYIAGNCPSLSVVLVATTWAQLVASDNFPTRVVFLDADAAESVSLPARIRACRATGAVVVVTTAAALADPPGALAASIAAAGAAGLVSKAESFAALLKLICGLDAIDAVTGVDEDWRPPPSEAKRTTPVAGTAVAPKLSRGEAEALALYASGKTMVEVAREMNVQFETAKTFLRRVREKYAQLGRPATNRSVLTSNALEDGFLN